MMRRPPLLVLPCLLLAACGEQERVTGNGAGVGNAQAVGRIVQESGTPAAGVLYDCQPLAAAPWEPRSQAWSGITSDSGFFRCTDLPPGAVGIEVYDLSSGQGRWIEADASANPRSTLDTLGAPGRLRVALLPGSQGTLHFSGLTRMVSVRGEQELEISRIPAGWKGSTFLSLSIDATSPLDSGLHVPAGGIDSAGYTRTSSQIRIPLEGGLTTSLLDVPLLLRLDSSWKGFASSLPDGSDLRLRTLGGKPLPVEVASWDRVAKTGELWTRLDTLAAPGSQVDLILDWGIPLPAAPSKAVFTETNGWRAAWPLGDSGTVARDLLGASPGAMASVAPTGGVVGKAGRFDGRQSEILIISGDSAALAGSEGATLTYSCWARARISDSYAFLMGTGSRGAAIALQRAGGIPWWLGREYRGTPNGSDYRRLAADTTVWTHLALTIAGDSVFFYVDGTPVSERGFNNADSTRLPLGFAIGAGRDSSGSTHTTGHFPGDIDEVWVQSVARSPQWIHLTATNQRPSAPKVTVLK